MIKTTQHLYESATAASCRRTATTECGGIFSLFTPPADYQAITLLCRIKAQSAQSFFTKSAGRFFYALFGKKQSYKSHYSQFGQRTQRLFFVCFALSFVSGVLI